MDRTPTDSQWWLGPEDDRSEKLLRVVRQIRQYQEYRKMEDLLHASMYGNMPLLGFGYTAYTRPSPGSSSRLSLNVVRNMTAAVTSKIAAKNRPKPTFVTEGSSDYELKRRAEMLEKFVGGVFYDTKYYTQTPLVFRDACIYGTGCFKVSADRRRKRVRIERVVPWEIVVDDGESLYGEPRSIYHRRYIDRMVLRNAFGDTDEKRGLIDACPQNLEDTEFGYQTTADQILVTEGWHLPSGPGADDGRHSLAIDGLTLLDERYDYDHFPFAFIRWTDPTVGFFGVGLAEELTGIQVEINKLLLEIQRGHHLIKGRFLLENGSKVVSAHLNNDLGAIVKYSGVKPEYLVPMIIAPEVYKHLWDLYTKAYEICGISQLSATGQKPAGLNSAVAQRTFEDIQTERFLEVGLRFEQLVLDTTKLTVEKAREVGKGMKVKSALRSRDLMDTIAWGDVDMDEDRYFLKVFPTSMLPSTPAGRMQWAQDMIQGGIIPPEDVLDIIDFPDTEEYAKRKNAARRVIERNISEMIRTGEPVSPEPFDNHALALKLVTEAYHMARLDRVPEDRLELLREYATKTADFISPPPAQDPQQPLLDQGQPPLPAAPPPPMGPPPGGMPPPPAPGAPPGAPLQ